MRKILALALFFLITSCAKERACNEVVINGFDDNYSEENAPLSSFVDKIEVIPLKRSPEAILTGPRKIVCYKDKFYMLDNNRLFCYGASGDFICFIGERGHGHGEYINIATFVVFNDTVWLLDSFKNTMMTYTLDGTFVSEQEAPQGTLANVEDAVFEEKGLLFMANYIFNDQNAVYTRWNTSTNQVDVVEKTPLQTDGTKEAVGMHSFSDYAGNIRYILPFSDVIKSTKEHALRFRTAKKVLTDSDLEGMTNFSIMTYADHMDDFVGFNNIFETENYLLLTFSNLEYVVVDKNSNECFRRMYRYNEGAEAFPLVNILSSTGDALIGVIEMERYDGKLKNKIQEYISVPSEEDYDYAIVMYHAK